MSYPSDILLPANSKYVNFVNTKFAFNTHYDITWSFTYALTGSEHGFTTFFTTTSALTSGFPGQYLGYSGQLSYITDESDITINTETLEPLTLEDSGDDAGVFCIAFDSSGLFALSSSNRSGVGLNSIKKNSLIIRDSSKNVIFNQELSSLDTSFSLASFTKNFKTLRFRYANAGTKLYIDYRYSDIDAYKNLLTLPISFYPLNYEHVYLGFSYCSPVSSSELSATSTIFLKNFHSQGEICDPTYVYNTFTPITASSPTSYVTITGVSANRPTY